MSLPLEDLFNDVVAKAQRGLRFTDETLADKAGVEARQVAAIKEGATDMAALVKLAPHLGLHGPSLVEMADHAWMPKPVELAGLALFNTVHGDMTVNSFLLWDPATRDAVAFDTGATAAPVLERIRAEGLTLRALFITHTHPDHIADIASFKAPEVWVHAKEPCAGATPFEMGRAWQFGALHIATRSTWGHSQSGTSYVVTGLAKPVVVVGDALFASSMGGGMVSFADALATNRKELFTLPDETIVCPGHGPMTTIGEEKTHNPFYPEFKEG